MSQVYANSINVSETKLHLDLYKRKIKNADGDAIRGIIDLVDDFEQEKINKDLVTKCAFPDICQTPYKDAVNHLFALGIVKGYDDDTFRPYNNITRSEFLKMALLAGVEKDPENGIYDNKNMPNFIDEEELKKAEWAWGYINYADNNNIINGYDTGEFKPLNNILRKQAIKILSKIYCNAQKDCQAALDDEGCKDTPPFDDIKKGDWSCNYIDFAYRHYFLEDLIYYSKYILPDTELTRGEMAQLAWNLYDRLNAEKN
ncbi:S-layer homology domain-containing protein [Desulfonema limicola]|uniref:S-layer homology domain-containing protein n=1 Tax=Desulfonema limicola TaxID=45656 RepID=A0A975GJI4_9BACT|nr:S-layer homology domain-containing protein [Desulfonema limicola]QTA83457.1 S-layer homology domain-containing protein [Desulfonema limicola]